MLANLGHDLWLRQLVNGFNANDTPTEFFLLKLFFELALGLTRPEDQEGLGVAHLTDHLVVVVVQPLPVPCLVFLLYTDELESAL